MFKSIQTTEIMFAKKSKIKAKRGDIAKRPGTPRPNAEEILSILTSELDILPTINEGETAKKVKPSAS